MKHFTTTPVKTQSFKFILFVGLIAGALDISVALADYAITRKNNPLVILKYKQSSLFTNPFCSSKQSNKGNYHSDIYNGFAFISFGVLFKKK